MDENTPSKLSVAKKSITDIDIFKTPNLPPLKKKKRVKVLDEDSYVEEMAKIIQRDFFPDLEKLKAQNEFLDATERKDYRKLRELYSKYSGGQKPPPERFASPATFETPHTNVPGTPLTDGVNIQNSNVGESQRSFTSICSTKSKNGISDKHSLDSFLAAYTSEDNNSFQDIMEEMGRKSRIKFAEQLQIEHESQLKSLMASNVPSIEEQADQYKQPEALDTWSYRAKNYIMYVPDGETSRLDCIDNTQEVVHTNTRMEIDPFDYQRSKDTITQIAKSQERILSGRIGVDGSTLLDNKSKQGGLNTNYGGLGGGTVSDGIRLLPMSSAHSLVRTPSPNPGAPGESPLMTWGQIEGTPFRLDGGDTPLPGKGSGTSFKMGVTSKREQIALSLAPNSNTKDDDNMNHPSPGSQTIQSTTLTPTNNNNINEPNSALVQSTMVQPQSIRFAPPTTLQIPNPSNLAQISQPYPSDVCNYGPIYHHHLVNHHSYNHQIPSYAPKTSPSTSSHFVASPRSVYGTSGHNAYQGGFYPTAPGQLPSRATPNSSLGPTVGSYSMHDYAPR